MSEPIKSFKDLSLSIGLQKSLEKMNFINPTPIQAKAIPVALQNRDIIACAQTGTGKTAAFCIPILSKLEKGQKLALILVPTREIAAQIAMVLKQISQDSPFIKQSLLIGGTSMYQQIQSLKRSPNIIIATPGRLVDHLRRGTVSLFKASILVLDEADRMLDMGFTAQLNEILRFLPSQRQTLLFSATFPQNIEKLAGKYLKDPVRVSVGAVSKPVEVINQKMISVPNQKKNGILVEELYSRTGSILIFARTKHRTDSLTKHLNHCGFQVNRLHGGRSQSQRNHAIDGFRSGKFNILVATDIAARGIDIPQITHVINYDLPKCTEDYVHRIGRTARAGASGNALSLVCPEEQGQWKRISKLYQ
ncbi:MAG: DEAD/DEAH box helicase [Oligoflexia bacterium]|nr:DEAD/DEAH box helicase [Oligoflexia bacterium]